MERLKKMKKGEYKPRVKLQIFSSGDPPMMMMIERLLVEEVVMILVRFGAPSSLRW